MSKWRDHHLIDLTEKIGSGATPRGGKEAYKPAGTPLIRSQNVLDFTFSDSGLAFIDDDQAEKLKNVIVETGDILINITGDSVARVCEAPANFLPARVNQHVAILRPSVKLSNGFLKYYLLAPRNKGKLLMLASSGATRNALTKGMLESFKINLPPLPEQKAIAHILGTLDDKIELNRKMNETLEQMAQALFKSWFVDFDPVIDKALAAGNPIPEPLQKRAQIRQELGNQRKPLPAHIAEQFPDSFIFTEELGWIPEGWEVDCIRDIIDVVSKGTTPRKSDVDGYDEEVPFLKARDISDLGNISNDLDLIPRQVHQTSLKRSILQTGDILITIAGTIGRVTVVPEHLTGCNCNQAIAFIRLSDKDLYGSFVFQHLRSAYVENFIREKTIQAVQANISLETVKSIDFVNPGAETLMHWKKLINSIENRITLNKEGINQLSASRDTLLPKLISGELRVPEAEQLIAEHV